MTSQEFSDDDLTEDVPVVLVVDDDRRNRRLLDAMLVPGGYRVIEAVDGTEALQRVKSEPIDLVLLDIMMPGIDGIETCHQIRQHPHLAFLPIIFVTALGDRDARVRGKAVGADDFLTKPVDEIELLIRVRNLILVKQYREQLERQNERLELEVARRTAELRKTVARVENTERALRRSYEITVQRLAQAAEFRDDATAKHIQRMALYCAILSRRLSFTTAHVQDVRLAAALHDVGKIAIPDYILLKPGKLTDDEYEIMKGHAALGYNLLTDSQSNLMQLGATIAFTHHEKVDGSGYPRGLVGEEIPLEGRIAAIADVFDALTSARPYKTAFSIEKAMSIMREGADTHFDGRLLELFFDALDEVKDIIVAFADG